MRPTPKLRVDADLNENGPLLYSNAFDMLWLTLVCCLGDLVMLEEGHGALTDAGVVGD